MEQKEIPKLIYQKMMEQDYCTQWLGAELLDIAEGYCKLKMQVRKDMLNGYGLLHGGMAFALADSALAFASSSYGRVAVSINANIIYSKSAKLGEQLIAEAKALNVTHKTADFDVTLVNETGEVYYYFRGTVYRTSREIDFD
ncbi:MAG: hotdog fold thioesterase [Bacteroidota bacterium]